MFEALITQVLNSILGKFIENIDSKQLDISVVNGDVQLNNVKLKPTLFDSMPLPFSLAYGQVGELKLKIPIWNMFNNPLIIEITDLFALVRPKHIKEWNEEVEVFAFQDSNQGILERFEIFSQSAESLIKKDPGSIDKLIAKIIDNVQIKIKNIYIRYEDAFSAPNQGNGKFVMGVLLKSLSINTTDSSWQAQGMQIGEELNFKVAKIENFSLFLDYETEDNSSTGGPSISQMGGIGQREKPKNIDFEELVKDKQNKVFQEILEREFGEGAHQTKHYYIIERFGMEARIKYNKNPLMNQLPEIDIDLLFGGLFKDQGQPSTLQSQGNICVTLKAHSPQIMRILKLLEYIGYYNQFQQGALTRFQKKAINQDLADEYIRLYCEWKLAKDSKKPQVQLINSLRDQLMRIEVEYPPEKFIVLRKFASKLIDQKLEQQKTEEEIQKKVGEMQKEKIGWGLFISRERKESEQKAILDFKKKMEEELNQRLMSKQSELDSELVQLTEDLSKQQVLASAADFDKLPHGYIRYKIKLSIPQVKLSYYNEFEQCLLVSDIKEQLTLVDIGKGLTRASFSIYSIKIRDQWSGSKAFPNVLDTREISNSGQVVNNKAEAFRKQISNGGQGRKQAFIFRFESNDQMVISPFKIEILTEKTVFVVANLPFISEVQRSALKALGGEQLDFSFYKEAATEKAMQYMDTGKEFIESIKKGEYSHQSLDVTLFMTAPVFIIPENIFQPEKPCLIVDTGSISLKSYLIGHTTGIEYKLIKSPNSLYDRYEATFFNFQINFLERGLPLGIVDFARGSGSPAIKEFTAKISLFNCVEPMHPLFPTVEIDIVIKNFELHCGSKFLEQILRVKNKFIAAFDTQDEDILKQFVVEGKKSQLQKSLESGLKQYLKREINEASQLDLGRSESQADEFYDLIEDQVDEVKKFEKQQSLKRQQSKISESTMSEEKKDTTNMKVYFSIEKLQILLQQDVEHKVSTSKNEIDREDILNILMLHFGLELHLDRQTNLFLNLSIFKIAIEDVQTEAEIAPSFRMILSSPLVDSQRQNVSNDKDSYHFTTFRDISFQDTYFGGVTEKSLMKVIGSGKSKSEMDESDEDEFQDAVSTIEQREKYMLNEFDLSVTILDQSNIDVVCTLSDMRFVFALPTAQKLVKVGLGIQGIFLDLEQEEKAARIQKIQRYNRIAEDIGNDKEFQSDELRLANKIMMNFISENDLSLENGKALLIQVVQDFFTKFQQQGFEKEKPKASIQDIKTELMLDLKASQFISQMNVSAKLKNFSIWIPLQAQDSESQIFNLSFMAELIYSQKTQSYHKEKVTQDNLIFQLETLSIQIMNHKDMTNFKHAHHSQMNVEPYNMISEYSVSRMLDPCNLSINLYTDSNDQTLVSKSDIAINIDPLKLRVGFRHIDFANVVLVEVTTMLDYLQKLQDDLTKRYQFESKEEISPSTFKRMIAQQNIEFEVNREEERKQAEENQLISLMSSPSAQSNSESPVKMLELKAYDPQLKVPSKISSFKIICNSITVQMSDDSDIRNDRPLFLAQLKNMQLILRSHDRKDDAGTYILKKLGAWQKLHPRELHDSMYLDIQAFLELNMDYYNHRSQTYEPLIEPWNIQLSLNQLTQYTNQIIEVQSNRMFNLNITFGMALTLQKIKERITDSFNQATIMQKIEKGQVVTVEQVENQKAWRKHFLSSQKSELLEEMKKPESEREVGFIFQNHTGLEIAVALHDYSNGAVYDVTGSKAQAQQQTSEHLINENEWKIKKDEKVFKTLAELKSEQKEILQKKMKNQQIAEIEDEPINVDIQIKGFKIMSNIQIENMGIYAYRAQLSLLTQAHQQNTSNHVSIKDIYVQIFVKIYAIEIFM